MIRPIQFSNRVVSDIPDSLFMACFLVNFIDYSIVRAEKLVEGLYGDQLTV